MTMSDIQREGGPVGPRELRLCELVREAAERWGDGVGPLDIPVAEFEGLGARCSELALDALAEWLAGDNAMAAERAAQAATIEGLVLGEPSRYTRLHEVLRHG